jgi:hypothetical protein
MTSMKVLVLTLLPALLALAAPADSVFDLKVTRVRTLRDQPGDLHIDSQGIAFRSTDGKIDIAISMQDLREASVADVRELRFETYEVQKWRPRLNEMDRREYTFRAPPDAPVEAIAQFLAVRVHRPVVGHYDAGHYDAGHYDAGRDKEGSQFRVAAFHRRALRGTSGTLEIGEDSIRYISDRAADSRTWLYRDIETIGRPDAFRFRVTTNRETYVLELKGDLPEAAFELAWSKVYNRFLGSNRLTPPSPTNSLISRPSVTPLL